MRLRRHCSTTAVCAFAGLACLAHAPGLAEAAKSRNAILLSQVQSLTLRSGRMTTHRRVPALPQLACEANPQALCDLYTIDTMRCINQGTAYGEQDVQWSCSAALPPELKLGSTDVVCEGYAVSDDPYVLKGSCAVKYRLLLTDYGEHKYPDFYRQSRQTTLSRLWDYCSPYLFWAAFVAVVLWIVRSALTAGAGAGAGARGGPHWRWGGGGGGGGGGFPPGFGPGNDPPPPYPGLKPDTFGHSWRPGFWSGLAGGAAAGYYASRRNNQNRYYDGDGDSTRPLRRASSNAQPLSTTRHQSTGFGSTLRR